ncbi:MAG: MFS transporter [Dysgonamonadaceae bacterium]|jgi:MFS family permease|nr:MFS transporter [Dysgonamonadaceae bacterium]
MMNNGYNKTPVFIAACAGLAFFGVTMLALGPVLSHLGEGANALPATLSIGIIAGTVIFGPVVDKFGYKWLLITGSALALIGIQGLAQFSALPALHASMLMLGVGGGILNGETNALVSEIYDDNTRGGRLSVLGAFYCIGALSWTLLNYFIKDHFTLPLNIVSVIMGLFIVFFIAIQFPKPKPYVSVSFSKTLGLLKYPALVLFAALLFFQSGFEGIAGNFTIRFLEGVHGTAADAATLSLTWFTVGMLVGRLFLPCLMKKLGDSATLCLYLCVALGGVAFLYFASPIAWVYAATALLGFGVGATYPVVFNYLGGSFKEMSGTVFSIAIFIALWGQFAFNKITGIWFDQEQFRYFPAALAFAIVMMLVLLPIAKNKLKK